MIIHPDNRGRTAGGRYTYRPLLEYEPDDYPPDSRYWQRRANQSAIDLARLVGDAPHAEWAELVWPGAEIDNFSWRSIAEMNETAVVLARTGERDLGTLARAALAHHYGECACVLPEQSCRVCRVSYPHDTLPFEGQS